MELYIDISLEAAGGEAANLPDTSVLMEVGAGCQSVYDGWVLTFLFFSFL